MVTHMSVQFVDDNNELPITIGGYTFSLTLYDAQFLVGAITEQLDDFKDEED